MLDPQQCVPTWYSLANKTCPYGIALPGDVTLLKDPGVVDFIAVAYGYTPYLVCLLAFLDLVALRGSRQLALCMFAAALPLASEILVKPLVAQPRPGSMGFVQDEWGRRVGSCVLSCGAPSSHATISIGLWLFVFLDVAARVVPSSGQLLGQAAPTEAPAEARAVPSWPLRFQRAGLSYLMPRDVMTASQFTAFILFWSFLLLPVPLMRVRSYDHSVEQVLLGCIIGVVYAIVWHRVIVFLTYRCASCLGARFCCALQHNYLPADFQIRIFDNKGVQGAKIAITGCEEWKQRHAIEPARSVAMGNAKDEAWQQRCVAAGCAAAETVVEGRALQEP